MSFLFRVPARTIRTVRPTSFSLPVSLLAACALAATLPCAAAAQAPRPRITKAVDDSVRVALPGSISPLARPEFDLGEVPAATQLTSVKLLLKRSPEQAAALTAYLEQLQQSSSPNFHRWLTPDQFGQLYGPADEDIAAITGWLESEGLTGVSADKGRIAIQFSGNAAQIERVFQTSIHSFKNGSREFLSNTTDPRIPAALSPVVAGIYDLSDLQPTSHLVYGPDGRYNPALKKLVTRDTAPGSAHPELTGKNGTFLYITAADGATLYNTPNKTLNANFTSGATYDGTGATIGVGGTSPIDTSIVVNYRTLFLGDKKAPTVTNDDATSTNAQNEAYLDLDVSGGMAPGATQHFYTAPKLSTAITHMLSDNSVDVFNLSFGECEFNLGATLNQAYLGYWQQAAGQGISVTVSSGDSDSAGCDGKDDYPAYLGLAVNGLASTPYNLAIGGTDTYGLVTDFSTYVGTTEDSNYFRSLLKPIPESPWNDSQVAPGPISQAVAATGRYSINGGGGGASSCSMETLSGDAYVCTSGYAKPSWQKGTGVPADKVRDLPDLSLMAGPGYDSGAWLVCTESGGDCSVNSSGEFFFSGIGGTSASAPAFAGILALIRQKTGDRLGQAANEIYSLFNGPHAGAIFNDITTGNNSPPCQQPNSIYPSPNCVKNTVGNYFESGYNAGTGYDQATGLGSVNATNLISYWSVPNGTATATVAVQPASSSILRGASLSVAITVSGGSGTPAGTVTLSSGTYSSAAASLSSGKATIVIPAGSLAVGSDTLTASYSGSPTYASATGEATVKVTEITPAVTVTPASSTVASTSSLSVAVAVSATSGTPTGTVTLTGGGYTSPATALASGKATIVIPAGKLTVGSDKLTASYSGDSNDTTASGTATVTVTQGKVTPTVKVTPASSSVARASSLSVAIQVTSTLGTPTGTVTLFGGGYTSKATTLSAGKATIVIPASTLKVAKDVLTASYSGDAKDNTATGTASVTVTKLNTTVTVTPASAKITHTSSLVVTVKVSSTIGTPGGSFTLSGGGYTSPATYLTGGTAKVTIPAGKLAVGTDTLTVTYPGGANYNAATGKATVTVTKLTPTVTVTPAAKSIVQTASLVVTVKVAATGSAPSGTVTLSSGSYTSAATALSGGSAKITISAGKLAVGTDTLTASYSGDGNDLAASGHATETVTQ